MVCVHTLACCYGLGEKTSATLHTFEVNVHFPINETSLERDGKNKLLAVQNFPERKEELMYNSV